MSVDKHTCKEKPKKNGCTVMQKCEVVQCEIKPVVRVSACISKADDRQGYVTDLLGGK